MKVKLKTITGDTDSLYLEADHEINAGQAERIGELVNEQMKKILPPPMDFSYEAFARRVIIFEKKNYVAMLEGVDGKQTMKFRGVPVRRRDWTPLTKEVLEKCYDFILKEGKVEDAIKYSRDVIQKLRKLDDIRTNPTFAEKLILSKKIGRNLDNYAGLQPHVEICKKMKERGESYGLGDRIQYLVIPGTGPMSKRVETPSWVMEHDGRIDNEWYIEVQLVKPLGRLFEALGVSVEKLTRNKEQSSLFEFM
jgi:DNA polymerase elongation subunit (family B)